MSACRACGAELETPVACGACDALQALAAEPGPFAVLGLAPAWRVDAAEVQRRARRFSRLVHPDFHGGGDAKARELAERHSATLNRARDVLADDARRAAWLVEHLGGPSEADEREMPQAFLMEVLEWNEALEEAEGGDAPRLEALRAELAPQRAELLERVGGLLEPLPERGAPALTEARRALNAVRYVDRALARIAELQLERPPAR